MRAARFSFAVPLLLFVAVPAFGIETGGFDSDGVQI
jgi:hypothetical protein